MDSSYQPTEENGLIERLAHHYWTSQTQAIVLTGSLARDDATAYSDIDLLVFVEKAEPPDYRLEYMDGRLISISQTTIAAKQDELQAPQTAIWAVPGLRQAKVLRDPDGHFGALHHQAKVFEWLPLQSAADAYASEQMMGYVEEAHKIMSGLLRRDESTIVYGTWGMVLGMANVLLVQRGVLIPSENAYIDLVQETAGRNTPWTQDYRLATGLDTSAESPARGRAALRLYCQTAAMMQAVCRPQEWAVVEQAISIIQRFLKG